jgi:hypothetical protein
LSSRKNRQQPKSGATATKTKTPGGAAPTVATSGTRTVSAMTDRREERARGRRAAAEARRRQQRLRRIIAAVLGVVAVAVIGFFVVRELTKEDTRIKTGVATETDAGTFVALDGEPEHIEGNIDYNSDPPTGGDHSNSSLPWGVYTEPQSDERMVHSLEHGGVIIQYDCDLTDDCDTLVQQLTPLATKYVDAQGTPVKLIMAPRSNLEHLVAVTSWTRLLTLDQFDQAAIDRFIEAYIDQGPEKFPTETQLIEEQRQSGSP